MKKPIFYMFVFSVAAFFIAYWNIPEGADHVVKAEKTTTTFGQVLFALICILLYACSIPTLILISWNREDSSTCRTT